MSLTSQQLAGYDYSRNETTGVRSITLRYFVATKAEISTVGSAYHEGIPLVSRRAGNWNKDSDDHGYWVDLLYEGSSEEDENGEEWSFESQLTQDVIEQHPQLEQLLDDYGGRLLDGKVVFPDFWDGGSGVGNSNTRLTLGLSDTSSGETPHPFAGARFIHYHTIVATRTYYATSISNIYNDVGEIFDKLPGDAPPINFKNGQNWIKRNPLPSTSGDGYVIRETYESSLPGGWKKGLHQLIIR